MPHSPKSRRILRTVSINNIGAGAKNAGSRRERFCATRAFRAARDGRGKQRPYETQMKIPATRTGVAVPMNTSDERGTEVGGRIARESSRICATTAARQCRPTVTETTGCDYRGRGKAAFRRNVRNAKSVSSSGCGSPLDTTVVRKTDRRITKNNSGIPCCEKAAEYRKSSDTLRYTDSLCNVTALLQRRRGLALQENSEAEYVRDEKERHD